MYCMYILYMFIVKSGIHNINTAYHQKGFYSECCLKFKITFHVPVAADCIKLQFVSQQLFIYFLVFRSLCPKYLWCSWVTPMQRRRVWLWLQAPVWTAASEAKTTPSPDTSLCTTSTATCQLKLKLRIFYLKTNTQQTYENNLTFLFCCCFLQWIQSAAFSSVQAEGPASDRTGAGYLHISEVWALPEDTDISCGAFRKYCRSQNPQKLYLVYQVGS